MQKMEPGKGISGFEYFWRIDIPHACMGNQRALCTGILRSANAGGSTWLQGVL